MADTPAGIREVAAHAGISVGTVSNALSRPDIVAEPARRRVRANELLALGVLPEMTAQLLLDEALGEGAHRHRQAVFEPELVVRRSSQARPGPAG